MSAAKIAVTIDRSLLSRLDQMIVQHRFPNRSRTLQEALRETLDRLDRGRLARECAKLNPSIEQAVADEGLNEIVGS
jgi:metal-responsive CopG/Arc/MetJ family transcriptional regulator